MGKMFFGGVPTKPEVDALMALDLKEGDEIKHERIAEIIGSHPKSNRYRSIIIAWRSRLLRERNLELGAIHGTGYRVLLPSERISAAVNGMTQAGRKVRRITYKTGLVEENNLSQVDRQKRLHLIRLGAQVLGTMQDGMKSLEPPIGKPEQNPTGAARHE